MNQILITNDIYYIEDNLIISKNKNKIKYILILLFSIVFFIILLFYLLFSYFSKLNKQKQTNIIKEKYTITSLYSSSSNYEAIKLSDNISIIGLIEIPSINISYPILENTNENLLKISVCRFSGPLPNRLGNLCIAGHNYKNNMMFSNLYKLNIGDSIFITDLNNVRLEYTIFEKYIVKENNLNCTNNTFDTQITLITCNNLNNSERTVIKAKMKG